MSSALGKRALSGIVLAPLIVGIILWGGIPFLIFAAIGLLIALYEWYGMIAKQPLPLIHGLVGLIYLTMCGLAFVYLRTEFTHGAWLTLALMLCVWASDIGAYFTGKTIGGPKLAPAISPNKTWAGLAGSMFFCGMALVVLFFVGPHLPFIRTNLGLGFSDIPVIFAGGLVLGLVGQAGDLFISGYKRRAGLKDTGHLIPGHGGLLDRIDALLLVAPAFLILVTLWLM